MGERPQDRDADDEGGGGPANGTPRWVKIFGIIALLVIVLLIVLKLLGAEHGPGRHTPGGGTATGHIGLPFGITHGVQEP